MQMVRLLKIQDVLTAARSFLLLQLNADYSSIKFSGAKFISGTWTVGCSYEEKASTTRRGIVLQISDSTGEVISFTSV